MRSELRGFEPGSRLLLSSKTVEAKYLMVPDVPLVNVKVAGIVARAQRKYGVVIHGLVFMSNHFHIHVTGDTPEQIANFMRDTKSGIARAINELRGRSGVFWAERYHLQESSGEDGADVEQLSYVIGHGAKEGLVAEPGDWTGVCSARELLHGGGPSAGTWTDAAAKARTTEAQRKREPEAFEHAYELKLTPLPSLAGLTDAERRNSLAAAVKRVVADERERNGVDRVVTRRTPRLPHWDQRPMDLRQSAVAQQRRREREESRARARSGIRAIEAHARTELEQRRDEIIAAYREASAAFRGGRRAEFPPFMFPPGLPMTGADGLVIPRSRRGSARDGPRQPT